MFMRKSAVATLLAVALLAVGCASQKEPATKAIADAESALSAIKEDAAKYVPDQLQSVEGTINSLKDSLQKGDYKAIITGAPALTASIASLKDAAEAKKAEVMAALEKAKGEWSTMSADLPKMVEAIGSRLDILGKAKKLPKNLDAAKFDAAKTGFDAMKSAMGEATAAATSGNFTEAVSKAQTVKEKGAEIMAALGMTSG